MEQETKINTITIYENWFTVAESLKPADQGAFFMAICSYALRQEVKPLKPILQVIFDMAKPVIDKSQSRKKAQIASLQKRKKAQDANLQNGLQNDLQNDDNGVCKDVCYNKDKYKDNNKDKYNNKDKGSASTLSTHISEKKYPESVSEILAIAESVGVQISSLQAERYLLARESVGWKKSGVAINVIGSDLKGWIMTCAQNDADKQKSQTNGTDRVKYQLTAEQLKASEREKELTNGF